MNGLDFILLMACLILKLLDEPDIVAYNRFLQNMEKAKLLYAPECIKIDLQSIRFELR